MLNLKLVSIFSYTKKVIFQTPHRVTFKAAIIIIFLITIDQITVCNLEGVVCGDKQTENYHLTLLYPSALLKF